MTRNPVLHSKLLAALVLCGLAQPGCKAEDQASSIAGGYTFSQDLDGERRVLRIDSFSDQLAECMETSLPAPVNAIWKETELPAALHHSLTNLLFDELRAKRYEADTQALASSGTLICTPRPSEPDFCYMPQVIVIGIGSPWRFILQANVQLSDESMELVDEFRIAHEACWDAGTAMR